MGNLNELLNYCGEYTDEQLDELISLWNFLCLRSGNEGKRIYYNTADGLNDALRPFDIAEVFDLKGNSDCYYEDHRLFTIEPCEHSRGTLASFDDPREYILKSQWKDMFEEFLEVQMQKAEVQGNGSTRPRICGFPDEFVELEWACMKYQVDEYYKTHDDYWCCECCGNSGGDSSGKGGEEDAY